MKHYGDITKIKGSEVEPVDIICGGSPCQDLSVAGRRAGLAGERSGLFMEQIRIVKEMRDGRIRQIQLRGTKEPVRPRFMVWENVPGPSAVMAARTSEQCSKRPRMSQTREPLFLDLRTESGHPLGALWEMGGALLGEYMMHSFGEKPSEIAIQEMCLHWGHHSVAEESRLSQILVEGVHQKYYLSAKACQGILQRAENRGKDLPKLLKDALVYQATHSVLNLA